MFMLYLRVHLHATDEIIFIEIKCVFLSEQYMPIEMTSFFVIALILCFVEFF